MPMTMRVGSGSARFTDREHVLEHRDDEDEQHGDGDRRDAS